MYYSVYFSLTLVNILYIFTKYMSLDGKKMQLIQSYVRKCLHLKNFPNAFSTFLFPKAASAIPFPNVTSLFTFLSTTFHLQMLLSHSFSKCILVLPMLLIVIHVYSCCNIWFEMNIIQLEERIIVLFQQRIIIINKML